MKIRQLESGLFEASYIGNSFRLNNLSAYGITETEARIKLTNIIKSIVKRHCSLEPALPVSSEEIERFYSRNLKKITPKKRLIGSRWFDKLWGKRSRK